MKLLILLLALTSTCCAGKYDTFNRMGNSIKNAIHQHYDEDTNPDDNNPSSEIYEPFDIEQEVQKLVSSVELLGVMIYENFAHGFYPAVRRAKRASAGTGADIYLDSVVVSLGAVMDRQNCRMRVACNAARVLRRAAPKSAFMASLVELAVPDSW